MSLWALTHRVHIALDLRHTGHARSLRDVARVGEELQHAGAEGGGAIEVDIWVSSVIALLVLSVFLLLQRMCNIGRGN